MMHQQIGPTPAETNYSVIMGTLSLVASLIGFAALWTERVNMYSIVLEDMFVVVLYRIGGTCITRAIQDVPSCTTDESQLQRFHNKIMNGGCSISHRAVSCASAFGPNGADQTPIRCVNAFMLNAFQYLGILLGLGMMFMDYVLARRSDTTPLRTRLSNIMEKVRRIPHDLSLLWTLVWGTITNSF
ncbi:hypothetical protein F4810DRAFT_619564 [Camillea tinctor]|nr:hypothetical protein F4810DRAFT_619564 [Camillea tinctor]